MPYRTQYGSHYHMSRGCHGAEIPCDTSGLAPCSDCCGGPAGTNGSGAFGGGVAPGAGSHPGDPYAGGQYADMGGGTSDAAAAAWVSGLHRVVGSGFAPSVATQPMPVPFPMDVISQMFATGMVGSVDYNPLSGVLSFNVRGQQGQQAMLAQGAGASEAVTGVAGAMLGGMPMPVMQGIQGIPMSGVPEGSGFAGFTPPRPNGDAPKPERQRDYGETDTRDAIREIRGGTHNSMERYLQPDGTLTPEREALHRAIIDKVLSGKIPVDGQAVFRMLGGGPASGKSSVVKAGCVDEMDEQSTIGIDSDSLKEELPGYEDMAAVSPDAAAYYHEESSALAKRIMQIAFKENYNVTLDGTGNGSVESVRRKIAQARQAGHRVTAVYVTVDIDTAIERNKQRYDNMRARGLNPRKVPARIVASIHKGVSAIFPQVAADFDEVELYDNSGPKGSKPVLIARGGSGEPATPVPGREREYFEFLNKR